MQIRRSLGLFLAMTLSVSVISGCNSNPKSDAGSSNSVSTTGAVIENFSATGYPIVNKPITMKLWGIRHTSATDTWENNGALKYMEKLTGIHYEYTEVSADGAAEKRALLLGSGDLPDVFFRANLTNDEITNLGTEKTIIPIQGLIDKYGTNIKALYKQIDGLEGAFRNDDGNVYSLGQVLIPSITNHYVINKVWLKNVGKETPKTINELYEVLKAFKEKDANGNGDPNDEIPMSVSGGFGSLSNLLSAWGLFPNDNNMFVYPGTNKVKYAYQEESFKDALLFFNKLFKEGLLDPEFLVQDSTSYTAKGTANRIGFMRVAGAFVNVGNDLHWNYQGMEPFPDQNNKKYAVANKVASGNQFEISSKCKYPEAALRWVDYLYSEEGTILTWGGVKDETYKWIDNNTWDWILKEGVASVTALRANNTIQGGTGYPSAHPDLFSGKFWSHQNNKIEASLDGEQFRLPQTKCAVAAYPTVRLSAKNQEEIAFIMTDINNYVNQSVAEFITGTKDINKEWSNYTKTISSMGIANAIKIYQDKYDAFMAMKK